MNLSRRTVLVLAPLLLVAGGLTAAAATGTADGAVGDGRPPVAVHAPPPGSAAQAPRAGSEAKFPTKVPTTAFVAVALCKIGDTPKLVAGKFVEYSVAATNMSGQGGSKTGCGIPAYATAVTGRVQATGAKHSGSVFVSTAGVKGHVASVFTGKGLPGTSAFTQAVPAGSGKALRLTGSGTSSHVAMWVNGYYAQQPQGLVYTGTDPYVYSGNTGVVGVAHVSTGVADVTFDRDVSRCSVSTTAFYDKYYYADAQTRSDNTVRVYSWYLSSTTPTTTPVYIDNDVFVSVVC